MCDAVKHKGLLTLILLDALLAGARRPIELIGKVDNTQAVSAAHKGYPKKLKFFERTHKCLIGSVHEFIESEQLCRLRADAVAPGRWIHKILDAGEVH